MAYFPFFIDLTGKHVLIIGGGHVALHKAEKLLPFGAFLHMVAPKFLPELSALAAKTNENGVPSISFTERNFQENDLDGCFAAIAASDSYAINLQVSQLCRAHGILVNTVDDAENCTFLFPALLQEGAFSAGISTAGQSPFAAAELKSRLSAAVPANISELLSFLGSLREPAKQRIPDKARRAAFLKEAAARCLAQERPLEDDVVLQLFQIYEKSDGAQTAKAGSVTLVGAGCGAYDLITLRGLWALRAAEVLIYDDLLDLRLLTQVSEHCTCIYAGKRLHAHSMPQEDINALLIRYAKDGKRVVRLKGGDPFVFGRGTEEAKALEACGIPVQVVPGISSAIAIPEAAGIALTARGISQGFLVMTAHTAGTKSGLPEGLSAAAAFPGSLVFLMGLSSLQPLSEALLSFGKDAKTPAAVLHGAPDGAITAVYGTLSDIAMRAEEAKIPAPAVIVVGEAAAAHLSV